MTALSEMDVAIAGSTAASPIPGGRRRAAVADAFERGQIVFPERRMLDQLPRDSRYAASRHDALAFDEDAFGLANGLPGSERADQLVDSVDPGIEG